MMGFYFLLFICLVSGIMGAHYMDFNPCYLGLVLLPIFYFIKNKQYQAAGAVFFIFVGMLSYTCQTHEITEPVPPVHQITVRGNVLTYPRGDNDSTVFFLKNQDAENPWHRKIRVVLPFSCDLNKGDIVSMTGSMKPPRRAGNPGQFNYALYLKREGVFYTFNPSSQEKVLLLQEASGGQKIINGFRNKGQAQIETVLNSRESAILLGMILGKKEGLEAEQYRDFQKTGIVHIFAVSGLHIGFLLVLSVWLFSLFPIRPGIRLGLTVGMIILYGTLVGWPVSVLRASIMAVLGLLAYHSGREKNLLNALGLAGLIICIADPQAPFKIAFQLSFAATFGLIYIFPTVRKHMALKGKLADLVLIPFCAQAAVLPLVAYHFNLFTPVAFISNVFITYLAGAAVMLGFLCFASVAIVPFISSFFLYPAGFIIEIILFLVDIAKDMPGAYVWVATPGAGFIFLYYLALILGLLNLQYFQLRRVTGLSIAVCILFTAGFYIPAGVFNRGMVEIVFIDVGQGDAILIKSPGGKFILVDGGGSENYDVAGAQLLPYLHHRGIRSYELVLNTHPHTDHLQGLHSVILENKVRYIGLPASLIQAPEYEEFVNQAQKKKIQILALKKGHNIELEPGFNLAVLHPGDARYDRQNLNNESLVLSITYKNFSLLLTGDIETDAIQPLLKELPGGSNFILQVPHHGSKNSLVPEFYDAVDPVYAVISVGVNNIHGHPHHSILKLLEQKNLIVQRTDLMGAITFSSDGDMVRVKTFLTPAPD